MVLEVEAVEVAAAVVAVVIDFKQRKAPTIRSELFALHCLRHAIIPLISSSKARFPAQCF